MATALAACGGGGSSADGTAVSLEPIEGVGVADSGPDGGGDPTRQVVVVDGGRASMSASTGAGVGSIPARGQWQCPVPNGEVVGDVGLLPDGGSMECVYDYAAPNQVAQCALGLAALLPVVGAACSYSPPPSGP